MLWIPVTIAAAGFQTARTAMQQRLRALLSVSGAGFVRYVYGAPIAIVAVALTAAIDGGLPEPPARFWPIIAGGGLAQIVGTILMIHAFDVRDYAIGTVYTKTEVVQVAVFSLVFLGEPLGVLGWLATLVCFAGVVVLAGGRRVWHVRDRAVLYGLGAGGAFALASVGIRAASQSLLDGQDGDGHVVARALLTLAVMNTMQIVMHGGYLAVRERRQLRLRVRALAVEFGGRGAQCAARRAGPLVHPGERRVRTFGGGAAHHLRRRPTGGSANGTAEQYLAARWCRSPGWWA
ncbi:MAG: EamA family transporter [Ilumatobacteraceae bacterium]